MSSVLVFSLFYKAYINLLPSVTIPPSAISPLSSLSLSLSLPMSLSLSLCLSLYLFPSLPLSLSLTLSLSLSQLKVSKSQKRISLLSLTYSRLEACRVGNRRLFHPDFNRADIRRLDLWFIAQGDIRPKQKHNKQKI